MGRGMKAGKRPNPNKGLNLGGGNMQKQLAQVQAMQRQMEEIQAQVEEMTTSATSGGGAVNVTVNGAHQITAIELKPEVVDPDDIEMLQDLILTAANEALRQMDEIANNEMSKVTGGLNLPF